MNFSDGEVGYMNLSQSGSNITGQTLCTGTAFGDMTISGSISGDSLSMTASAGGNSVPMTGTVSGSAITNGTATGRSGSRRASLTWTATKQAAAPSGKECILAALDVYVWSDWTVEAHIYDPSSLVSSASMTGTDLSSPRSFVYDWLPAYPNTWFAPTTALSSGPTPTFPASYNVTINFTDSTSQVVTHIVTTFE